MAYYKYDGSAAAVTAKSAVYYSGTDGQDTIVGTAKAESFTGGEADTLIGGGGDDTYYIRDSGDRAIEEAGGGIDRISAWRNIDLGDTPWIENVKVSGDNWYGAGNALDNIVEGGEGIQQIYGDLGQDVLIGGTGADVFIVHKGEGNDVIQDFNLADDKLRLKAGFTSFEQLKACLTQVGADVKLDLGGGDGLIFRGLQAGDLTAAHVQLQFDPASVGALTFSDEFDTLSLWDGVHATDGVWRTDFGYQGSNGLGSYTLASNGEKQIYTSPYFRDHDGDFAESPFVVNGDGTMSIWARASSNPEIFGYGYTSGALTTKETFAQTYGYFEIRCDVPEARGAWPAFWLVPNDGSWPPELDVMETLSKDPNQAYTTVHSDVGGHTATGQANYVPDTADGMHTYGALWTPTDLVFYIDGLEVFRTPTPADMHEPMHMIVNMALGGWGGTIDPAMLPAEFKIDYVRAYDLPPVNAPAPAPAPPVVTEPPLEETEEPAPTSDTPLEGEAELVAGKKRGSDDADRMQGGADSDCIYGEGGGDILLAGAGADYLSGGAGADQLYGEAGADRLYGGLDNDLLSGGDDNDTLYGEAGDDTLGGGLGDDRLEGGDGLDNLSGDAGADILIGGLGADHLAGGAGIDQLYGDAGSDRLYGGLDNDLLSGGDDDDQLFGEAGADELHGGSGADRLEGGAEGDNLFGEDGADLVLGGLGDDYLSGGGGDDVLLAEAGADRLFGGEGADNLSGGEDNDQLFGDGGVDELHGGLGDDRLEGGAEGDNLFGEDGADILLGGLGADYLSGGLGVDQLYGEAGVDRLYGGDGGDLLSGGDDNDSLYGQAGDDQLAGDLGDDLLFGGEGADVLGGGVGADLLYGEAGVDRLFGGDGADVLSGDGDNDFLYGELGDDKLNGGLGDDRLEGGEGADNLNGADGRDVLLGGNGGDYLVGGLGDDGLYGEAGADRLLGGEGADTLSGGGDNDVLQGEGGADTLMGGLGADTFVFTALADSAVGAGDRILDFDLLLDRIDLSGIDANTQAAGNQAFTWAAGFTGIAGQAVLSANLISGQTTLLLDADGDAAADFQLTINGALTGTSGFIL